MPEKPPATPNPSDAPKKPAPAHNDAARKGKDAAREARLAEALKANIRRRKDAAKDRN